MEYVVVVVWIVVVVFWKWWGCCFVDIWYVKNSVFRVRGRVVGVFEL